MYVLGKCICIMRISVDDVMATTAMLKIKTDSANEQTCNFKRIVNESYHVLLDLCSMTSA